KETALGGLAMTTTGQKIARRVLIRDIDILPDESQP
ncbi:MAG TPA: serine dehydratase, partial [Chryseosolibacter sp.]